ncbi:MAG: hypothetical protein JW704_07590 [Anaerolineaceae bacterium]|nr:hypothetical protein [Anaerolineaceae bacterium]
MIVEESWIDSIRLSLPELPLAKKMRFISTFELNDYHAALLCIDPDVADYFEQVVQCKAPVSPQQIANWITGDVFAYCNQRELSILEIPITPTVLSYIIDQVENGKISRANGRQVLIEAMSSGNRPEQLIQEHGYGILEDEAALTTMVNNLITQAASEAKAYRSGKVSLLEWFVGQAMQQTHGKADPNHLRELIRKTLDKQVTNNQ